MSLHVNYLLARQELICQVTLGAIATILGMLEAILYLW